MQVGIAVSAGVAAARHDDVLVITLAGAVTLRTCEVAIERVCREADERAVRALVIDMTRTTGRMAADEWDGAIRAAEAFCLAYEIPCGLVVPTGMLESMRRHCARVSARQIIWVEFACLGDALLWAATWSKGPQSSWLPLLLECDEHATPQLLH